MTDVIPNRASGYHWPLLERQETIREHQTLNGIIPSDNQLPQFWEGDIQVTLFNFAPWRLHLRTNE